MVLIITTERKTIVTYMSDGTQKVYAFPFEYLRKTFIKVKAAGTLLTYGTQYTVAGNQIELLQPFPVNTLFKILRETTTKRLVAWEDASVLRAADLTLTEVQTLHLIEEAWDSTLESCLLYDEERDVYDALGRRIVNVGTPISSGDAAPKGYTDDQIAASARDIREEIKALEEEIEAEFVELREEIAEDFSEVHEEMEDLREDVETFVKENATLLLIDGGTFKSLEENPIIDGGSFI